MKKIINDPADYVSEALEGLVSAHPRIYAQGQRDSRVIIRRIPKPPGKVGVVSGGGFGHLPLLAGYVSESFLDACAVGDVFTAPSRDSVVEALRAADRGAGVVAVIGNYGGDKMAFAMASQLVEQDAMEVDTIFVADDVASAPPSAIDERRGFAGTVFALKIAGAAAEVGWPLTRVAAVTRKAICHCRTIGFGVSSCTIPSRGRPTFELEDGAIEMGMGIHGEQGLWRGPLPKADQIADEMVSRLANDQALVSGSRVAVLCNSLGATSIEELCILYRGIAGRLHNMQVSVAYSIIGHYATSMEMAGASVSFLLLDDEIRQLLEVPTNCPFWRAK